MDRVTFELLNNVLNIRRFICICMASALDYINDLKKNKTYVVTGSKPYLNTQEFLY